MRKKIQNFLVFVRPIGLTIDLGIFCIVSVELIALGEIVIKPWTRNEFLEEYTN